VITSTPQKAEFVTAIPFNWMLLH